MAYPYRKALIISILYLRRRWKNGDSMEMGLGQCAHRNAFALRDLLIKKYSYAEQDIVLLLETDPEESDPRRPKYLQPTRDNIITSMIRLVANAKHGDRFVFFYSGHGSNQLSNGEDPFEDDDMDEVIFPMDFKEAENDDGRNEGIIVDNEIYDRLVIPTMCIDCQLTAIIDSCHSGTMMDLSNYIYEMTDINSGEVWRPSGKDNLHSSPLKYRVVENLKLNHTCVTLGSRSNETKVIQFDRHSSKSVPAPLATRLLPFPDISRAFSTPVDPTLGDSNMLRGRILDEHQAMYAEPQEINAAAKRQDTDKPCVSYNACNRRAFDGCLADGAKCHEERSSRRRARRRYPRKLRPLNNCKAQITSWSACADNQESWEDNKGQSMAAFLIEKLGEDGTPTFLSVLCSLDMKMHSFDHLRKEHSNLTEEEFIFQSPQLSSLQRLSLESGVAL